MSTEGMKGRPRLVLALGGHGSTDRLAAEGDETTYLLTRDHTTIGSAADQHISLNGLQPEHAVVDWWPEGDEFVFRPLAATDTNTVNGKPIVTGLHHGDRVQVAGWELVFQRDEEQDHIRVESRREGGQYAGGGLHRPGGHENEVG
jgi:hypothetical protein